MCGIKIALQVHIHHVPHRTRELLPCLTVPSIVVPRAHAGVNLTPAAAHDNCLPYELKYGGSIEQGGIQVYLARQLGPRLGGKECGLGSWPYQHRLYTMRLSSRSR